MPGRRQSPPPPPTMRERFAVPFAAAILGVWVIVAISTVVTKEYTPLTIVTPVMLIAAGFVFGIKLKNGEHNGH